MSELVRVGKMLEEATVDLVLDLPRDPSKMSEEAKQKLGIG